MINIPTHIKKRDGRIVDFDTARISMAIFKAMEESGQPNRKLAKELAEEVTKSLVKKHRRRGKKSASPAGGFISSIEEIQDLVEETLIKNGHAKVVKTYILYRQKRAEIRQEKQKILEKEEIDEIDKRFDINALQVLRSRYLRKDERGKVVESPRQIFERVAIHAVLPDILYDSRVIEKSSQSAEWEPIKEKITNDEAAVFEGNLFIGKYALNRFHIKGLYYLFSRLYSQGKMQISWESLVEMLKKNEFSKHEKTINDFYDLMISRKFMPNTPALANFGNYLGMGSACFALDIDDSIESIMDTLKKASIVFKAGGGLGYNFSKLRPEGDFIKTTGGTSSGPLSFMRLFDTMTEVVKQGGIRRGANMGILSSNHPDIEKFISAKKGNKALKNFNISVLMTPDFWDYYKKNKPYPLINPRTKETVRFVSPRFLLEEIVYSAWESAEPGVIFQDRINEFNPFLKSLGPVVTTNPCGELLLYPNESCNLGSLNIWAFVKTDAREKKSIDWKELSRAIKLSARFLDNVIDINSLPLKEIEDMTLNTRKIGLGIMGLGDMFYDLKIQFNSEKGWDMMEKIAEFINYYSKLGSIDLAKERGSFPYFEKSFYAEGKLPFRGFYEKKSWHFDWQKVSIDIQKYGIRNSYTTVIAPTGSISMIAGCSSGIEPVFSLVFQKNVAVGSFYFINPIFEREMLREGLFDDVLIKNVAENKGSVNLINYIPKNFKKVFITSHDISPEDHVKTLAAFQKWVDSSISKTNNFPAKATVEDMKKSYILAYELGCKGVTVFRDTSIENQVLVVAEKAKMPEKSSSREEDGFIRIKDAKAEGMAIYHDPSALNKNINGDNGAGKILSENSNGNGSSKPTKCPNCKSDVVYQEGCVFCPLCGWGLCV